MDSMNRDRAIFSALSLFLRLQMHPHTKIASRLTTLGGFFMRYPSTFAYLDYSIRLPKNHYYLSSKNSRGKITSRYRMVVRMKEETAKSVLS